MSQTMLGVAFWTWGSIAIEQISSIAFTKLAKQLVLPILGMRHLSWPVSIGRRCVILLFVGLFLLNVLNRSFF